MSEQIYTGLSQQEVEERIQKGLVNKVTVSTEKTTWQIIQSNVFTYFNFIFFVLAMLLVIVQSWNNLLFLPIVIINSLIGIVQELRARKILSNMQLLHHYTAIAVRDGKEIQLETKDLVQDDIVLFSAGDQIYADAKIVSGELKVNESQLTGEADEIAKQISDTVMSGSFVVSGKAYARLEKVGDESYINQLTLKAKEVSGKEESEMVRSVNNLVKVIGFLIIPLGLILFFQSYVTNHESFQVSIVSTVGAIIGMIPEGLYLLMTLALALGAASLARQKVLLNSMKGIESLSRVDVLCVDKTGTITTGQPKVKDINPIGDMSINELLQIAYSVEQKSEHPFAKAIVEKAQQENIQALPTEQFKNVVGSGIEATLNNHLMQAGSMSYIRIIADISSDIQAKADQYAGEGKTPLFFAQDGKLIGMITAADTIKEDSHNAITKLKQLGMQVVMLTGDNERTANAIAKIAGVDRIVAGVKPDGKEAVIAELQKQGKVAMVGDGINDAPALTKADIGIAIGAGTDVAIDSADIVLSNSTLTDVVRAVRLSRATLRNVKENLFWAFFYNLICIPLAAGLFGLSMNPMFGAAAMALSSVTVCMNALRLNLFKIDKDIEEKNTQREKHTERKEEKQMEKKIMIEGMMCGHCEKTVKSALEKIDGVASAEVSHVSKQAIVTLNKEVPNEELRKAVEAEDYTVTGIE